MSASECAGIIALRFVRISLVGFVPPQNPLDQPFSSGIIIDKCPNKDGIWLDESELEKIQIVVEEWEKKREENKAKLAPKLGEIEQAVEAKKEEAYAGMGKAKFPLIGRFVNGLVRGIVRLDD